MTNHFSRNILELGDAVQSRWQKFDFDDERLPGIASEELRQRRLHETASLDTLSSLMFHDNAGPYVPVSEQFGNAAVTVYRAPRFFIEALFWTEGTTAIHQHGFSGAFTVLLGSSFHARYSFEPFERVNSAMLLGNLQMSKAELLRQGDVRPIDAGSQFIHCLFHLESPSISLVVRTYGTRGIEPQFQYLQPGLAEDPFFKDPVTIHRCRYLKMLLSINDPSANMMLQRHLTNIDLHSAYRTIETLGAALREKNLFDEAMGVVRASHLHRVRIVEEALGEMERRSYIISRRRLVTDPGLRFFLAMLLNVPNVAGIRELTKAFCPGVDADEQIIAWITQVWRAHDADYGESNLDLIRYALEDPSDDHILRRFYQEYDESEIGSTIPQIREIADDLRRNLLFARIFQRPSGASLR